MRGYLALFSPGGIQLSAVNLSAFSACVLFPAFSGCSSISSVWIGQVSRSTQPPTHLPHCSLSILLLSSVIVRSWVCIDTPYSHLCFRSLWWLLYLQSRSTEIHSQYSLGSGVHTVGLCSACFRIRAKPCFRAVAVSDGLLVGRSTRPHTLTHLHGGETINILAPNLPCGWMFV